MAIDKRIKNCQEDTFNGTVICILSNIGYDGVEQNIDMLEAYVKAARKYKWYDEGKIDKCIKVLISSHSSNEQYCGNIKQAIEIIRRNGNGSELPELDETTSSSSNEDAIGESVDISSIPQELIIEALRKKQKQQDGLFVSPIGVIDESFDPYNLCIISEYSPEQIREETEEFNRRRVEEIEEPEIEDQIDIFGGIDETES
jgi:Cdc6-like AAA superfamily ATPase